LFDLMTTVSVLVDDIRIGVDVLCARLGIPEPRPQAFRGGPGIDAVFCRIHPKYAVAPTFLELVAASPLDEAPTDVAPFPVKQIAARQGDRRIKVHATEIAMPEATLLDLSSHLDSLGVPYGFVPPDRRERFFFGGNPAVEYDRSADAGLIIEAGRSGHLGLPEEVFTAPSDIPPQAVPETMVQIMAREYLVDDLDETLRILERNLRWSPHSISAEGDCRRAVMPFLMPRSAKLELVEARGTGRIAQAYDQLGAGPWTIRVSVVDVDAKALDLAARDTPFTLQDGVLRPEVGVTLGVPFEFIKASA
jgi:hypothetical protein